MNKGPFAGLNYEEISEEVQNNWRVMHKLQKGFADAANPRKVSDFTKHRIDRFKNHLPVLQVISNPGLKPRHWKQVEPNLNQHSHLHSIIVTIFRLVELLEKKFK